MRTLDDDAFHRLAEDLHALGAPPYLVRAAARAAHDETFAPHSVPSRSLLDVARDNIREGCVAGTWAATLATWQSDHASDEETRSELKMIAAEKRGHAALAWAIDAWAREQLDAHSHAVLDEELMRAAQSIMETISDPSEPALPPSTIARDLATQLQREVWT